MCFLGCAVDTVSRLAGVTGPAMLVQSTGVSAAVFGSGQSLLLQRKVHRTHLARFALLLVTVGENAYGSWDYNLIRPWYSA